MKFKTLILTLTTIACSACTATNPVKEFSIEKDISVTEVVETTSEGHMVRWGGEVLDIKYLGKNSLIILQVTEQNRYIRPDPVKKIDDKFQVVIFTPNFNATEEYRTGDLITFIGNAKRIQADEKSYVIRVIPEAIYSWLDLRENRQYDSTGIIAMSSIENQYLIGVIDSPWSTQDETDLMMRRKPVFTVPKKKSKNLVLFKISS